MCLCSRTILYVSDVPGCICFFFFQAEDGIRDLVRSRGLGDVYKRQIFWGDFVRRFPERHQQNLREMMDLYAAGKIKPYAVSYTHLTLPTSDLV